MESREITEKIDSFFSQFQQKSYKKGDILINADEEPTGIFFLKNGAVKLYAISKKGEELVINIYKPIAFFPMGWAINNTKNEYYYEAITDAIVMKAPREKVLKFLQSNPEVLYDLVQRIYRGLDGLFTRMMYMMSGGAYDRLVTEIVIQAKRFGKHTTDGVIEFHVSEKELAAQAGMTRETVSREMKVLKEKNLVGFNKNTLTIHDLSLLEAELSSAY